VFATARSPGFAIGIAVAGRTHATIAQTTIKLILIFIFAPSSKEHAVHTSDIEVLWFPGVPDKIRSPSVAVRQAKMEQVAMKRAIVLSAGILLAAGASAIAAERPGASSMSPGHEMQNSTSTGPKGDVNTKTKGASEYSPGDRMHDRKY
jgi:hypothetical protein